MTNQQDVAVKFHNVTYSINQKNLIANLNLTIPSGEVLALLGRSGSGKTTTLKLVNHLQMPTMGQVIVQGRSTTDWDAIQLRRRIGYVIQNIGLFPHFTIAQNVGLVPSLKQWRSEDIRKRVDELLDLVGLEPSKFAQRYPNQLSGGQKQRVGVARALAADPPILLMDEPFGALDPITRLELQQQLRQIQIQMEKTVVFVTHDIQEAFFLGTRIGLMYKGELVTVGTPEEFRRSPHPEAQRFMACLDMALEMPTDHPSTAHPLTDNSSSFNQKTDNSLTDNLH
ncbi:MAG: ATP-binding cassette domain-containing protein [Leptolyngbyaceae cyanobacterium]